MVKIKLIRHAESEFNALVTETANQIGISREQSKLFTYIKYRKTPDITDPPITDKGVQQCLERRKESETDLNTVKCIIATPMTRVLQTMRHVFNTKEDKGKYEILVHPLLRERWESQCDIPSNTLENRKEFSEADFKMMDSQLNQYGYEWFVEEMLNPFKKEKLKHFLKDVPKGDKQQKNHRVIDFMLDLSPGFAEDYRDFAARILQFKQWLKEFCKERQFKDGEVALVAHSKSILFLTGSQFDESCWPHKGFTIKNCDIVEYDLA